MSASGGQKPQFWIHFDIWGLLYSPLLPVTAKFGVLEQTQGLHCKSHLNVFIVSASGDQKPQFLVNFDIGGGGFCADPLLPMRNKFHALQQTHGIHLCDKFRLDRFIVSPWQRKKTIFAVFWTSSFHGVAIWQQSKKLNTGAQLRTFLYPTVSKSCVTRPGNLISPKCICA